MDDKRDEKEFDGDLAIDDSTAEQVTGGVANADRSANSARELVDPARSKQGARWKKFLTKHH